MLFLETRPGSQTIARSYDTAGRLDAVDFPGGLVDHAYYPSSGAGAGKLSQIQGPYGVSLGFTYEGPLATSTTWSGDITGSIAWQHNDDFLKIRETVTGATGSSFAVFGYDSDLLPTCASPASCAGSSSANAMRLTRSPQHGLVTGIALGNTNQILSYNGFGELARQVATYASMPLVDVTYDAPGVGRDALGRIVQKTEVIGGVTKVYGYAYDALGRLTEVTLDGNVLEHFAYDSNGNRLSAFSALTGVTSEGDYDEQDRLLEYGEYEYTYTANGELEARTNTTTNETTLYQYDVLGNLLAVLLPDGTQIEYLVDGRNRRVGKKNNGTLVKQWLYRDQLKPAAELDGSGGLVAQFVYGSKRHVPDYVRRGGVTYRVISDHLGSPRYVVNVANASDVPFRADYSAFGEVTGTGLDWMPFGFAGGHYDPHTELVRFGARDYDPEIGRWTSKDPIGFDGGQANVYAYVGNDPCNQIDPRGTDAASLAAAGALFCAADGPLPIGDLIGVPLLIAAGALAVAGAADWYSKSEQRQLDQISKDTGVPRDKLRKAIEKTKKATGLRGNENVTVEPDGTVIDNITGEEIGNVRDE